jgi:aminopeptidase N
MPQVNVSWSCDRLSANGNFGNVPQPSGDLVKLTLSQHDVLNEGQIWPMSLQVLLSYKGEAPVRLRVDLAKATVDVPAARGKPCPEFVFANDQDYGYGRFLLDEQSQKFAVRDLDTVKDLFTRTLLWGSLWDSVREAQMAPHDYLDVAQDMLEDEKEENLVQSITGHSVTALHRYVSTATKAKLVPRFETRSLDQMNHTDDIGLRIVWFRMLRALAETQAGREELKQILAGTEQIPGVQLRPLDRWSMVDALIALRDPDAEKVFAAERERDHTGDGLKYAYVAEAARPDAETKKKYFDDYLHNANRPEDWVEQSLGAFNYWNESELTAPYLKLSLEALPQVKRERKIFFVLAWLGAFIDGQQSPESDAKVHEWLNTAAIDPDLRLKVLEVVDELDRTVKIRQRYP